MSKLIINAIMEAHNVPEKYRKAIELSYEKGETLGSTRERVRIRKALDMLGIATLEDLRE